MTRQWPALFAELVLDWLECTEALPTPMGNDVEAEMESLRQGHGGGTGCSLAAGARRGIRGAQGPGSRITYATEQLPHTGK